MRLRGSDPSNSRWLLAATSAHRCHGAALPTVRRYDRESCALLRRRRSGSSDRPGAGSGAFALHDRSGDRPHPTGPLLARASYGSARFGLSVLPHGRRAVRLCRIAADRDLHDLPFADLDECSDARAGPRELREGAAHPLAEGPSSAGLRVFRPQRPCRQRRRLHHVSWAGRRDAADVSGGASDHGVVPGLSPEPRKNLRPQSDIFLLDWTAPADQQKRGHELLASYGIDVAHLTDCSVCHR